MILSTDSHTYFIVRHKKGWAEINDSRVAKPLPWGQILQKCVNQNAKPLSLLYTRGEEAGEYPDFPCDSDILSQLTKKVLGEQLFDFEFVNNSPDKGFFKEQMMPVTRLSVDANYQSNMEVDSLKSQIKKREKAHTDALAEIKEKDEFVSKITEEKEAEVAALKAKLDEALQAKEAKDIELLALE